MASSTYVPGLVHQERALCRTPKECLSIVPSGGRKQEMLRSSLHQLRSPLVGDPLKPMGWLFSDQCSRIDPVVDVQDAHLNSILLSFGISEHCTRRDQILQYLISGMSDVDKYGLDFSVISGLIGVQASATKLRLQSLVPRVDETCPYEVRGNESLSSIIYPSDFTAQRPVMDCVRDLPATSRFTVHPDGGALFTDAEVKMKDILSVFTEFHVSNKWKKQPMLVPHFARLDTCESQMNIQGPSLKMETMTFTPTKSPETIKLKPMPKKRSSKKASREKDLCRRSNLHAFESLLSLLLDKNRGKAAIISVKKSGPELSQLLTQFSAGIAGTGLAVLFSIMCKVSSGRTPLYGSTMFSTGFGSALVWLSWAVNKLRDTIVHINRSSSKVNFNEKEIMRRVDGNVNEIFFRSATILAIAVLRFA